MSAVVRERGRMCAMAPCHRKKKFGRLIDVDSASPRGLPVLKVFPLGFSRADWRLEKREPTAPDLTSL